MPPPTSEQVFFLLASLQDYSFCRCHHNNTKKNCTCVVRISHGDISYSALIARAVCYLDSCVRRNCFDGFLHLLSDHAYVQQPLDLRSPQVFIILKDSSSELTICTHLLQYLVQRLYSGQIIGVDNQFSDHVDSGDWRKQTVSDTIISGLMWVHKVKAREAKNLMHWLLFTSTQIYMTSADGGKTEVSWERVNELMIGLREEYGIKDLPTVGRDASVWRSFYKSADWMLHRVKIAWPFEKSKKSKRTPLQRTEGIDFVRSLSGHCHKFHPCVVRFLSIWRIIASGASFTRCSVSPVTYQKFGISSTLKGMIRMGGEGDERGDTYASLSVMVGVSMLEADILLAIASVLQTSGCVQASEELERGQLLVRMRLSLFKIMQHSPKSQWPCIVDQSDNPKYYDVVFPMTEKGVFLCFTVGRTPKIEYLYVPFGAMVVFPGGTALSCCVRCDVGNHMSAFIRVSLTDSPVAGQLVDLDAPLSAMIAPNTAGFVTSDVSVFTSPEEEQQPPMSGLFSNATSSPFVCSAIQEGSCAYCEINVHGTSSNLHGTSSNHDQSPVCADKPAANPRKRDHAELRDGCETETDTSDADVSNQHLLTPAGSFGM